MSELGNEDFTNDSTALYIHSETSNQRMGQQYQRVFKCSVFFGNLTPGIHFITVVPLLSL